MAERLVIHGGEVITCAGTEVISDGVVVVEGERIAQVRPASGFDLDGARASSATELVDATGRYVIPGLINMHEHLDNHRGTGSFYERAAQSSHFCILRAARNALVSLARGVTTVRDVGSLNQTNIVMHNAIEGGQLLGPRVFPCGRPIGMTGGHAEGMTVEADGVDALRHAARTELKAGAQVVKLMASGGFTARGRDFPWSPQLTEDELRAAIDEAHLAGYTAAAHAHPPAAIRNCVKAGIDTIEHGALMDESSAELMEEAGVYLIPTLDECWVIAEHGRELGRPAWLIEASRQKAETQNEVFALAVKGGVKCAVGTDVAGEMGSEMKHMTGGGMSAHDVLIAATKHGAEALKADDRLGTLEAGKLADVVVLGSDPRADLLACDAPELVVKGGVVHDPATLLAAIGPTAS